MEKGWSKLYRKLLRKPIWTGATPEQKGLLFTFLIIANHGEKWEENSSVQKIRTALKKLVKYDFLTDESTPYNRRITVVNWGVYQGLEGASTVHVTDGQQTTNRQLTPNKNLRSLKTLKT